MRITFNHLYRKLTSRSPRQTSFQSSATYWENRYASGGDSGPGSRHHLAQFKADFLNDFVRQNRIETIIEYGCGDGCQLNLADYPQYLGLDISKTAIRICRNLFEGDQSKHFKHMENYAGEVADLVLSLDVIYHLVEDEVYNAYMDKLFASARQFVIIYSSNFEQNDLEIISHIRHRKFTEWIADRCQGWRLYVHVPNLYKDNGNFHESSSADFFVYQRCDL
jgi:SAM-dependent methyltransferase